MWWGGGRDRNARLPCKIRAKLLEYKPNRAHLVPEKFIHDVSEYGNRQNLAVSTGKMWLPVKTAKLSEYEKKHCVIARATANPQQPADPT